MEGPISFWGYKEQESNLILPEHDDDEKLYKISQFWNRGEMLTLEKLLFPRPLFPEVLDLCEGHSVLLITTYRISPSPSLPPPHTHTQTTRMRTLIFRVWFNPPPNCPSRSSVHDHKFVTQWHKHIRFNLPVSMLEWWTSSQEGGIVVFEYFDCLQL